MTKHMMLLFLSDVKTDRETGEVARTLYRNLPPIPGEGRLAEEQAETRTTNESSVRYLLGLSWEGEPIQQMEKLFLVASKMVRERFVQGSDAVRNENGTPQKMTHLEYFTHRMEMFHVALASCQVISYDEDADVPRSMELAADIAHRVLGCISTAQAAGDHVVLHVDMSGGMRHANMLMLNILRLLQYSGVEIGKVLYSNYVRAKGVPSFVEEVDDIYHTLDLIAGAEEFARFGSVDGIEQYFAHRETSPELQKLLREMHNFSNEIKLCHPKKFLDIVKNLKEALDEFSGKYGAWQDARAGIPSHAEQVNDKLMFQLEQRLQKDYARLLDFHDNPLESVRWCIDHSYLQQAVLILTEMMPSYVIRVAKFLRMTKSLENHVKKMKKDNFKDLRFPFFFLNHYLNLKDVKQELDLQPLGEIDLKKERGRLHNLCNQQKLIKLFRNGNLTRTEFLQKLDAMRKEHFPGFYFQNWNELPEKILEQANNEAAIHWLKEDFAINTGYPLLQFQKKHPELISTCLSEQEWCEIAQNYTQLKQERNIEGHVKETGESLFQDAESLKAFLTKFIDRLEELHRLHPVEGEEGSA